MEKVDNFHSVKRFFKDKLEFSSEDQFFSDILSKNLRQEDLNQFECLEGSQKPL